MWSRDRLPRCDWSPGLQPPGHGGLVGPQAVELVQVLHLPHRLLVQLLGVGRLGTMLAVSTINDQN